MSQAPYCILTVKQARIALAGLRRLGMPTEAQKILERGLLLYRKKNNLNSRFQKRKDGKEESTDMCPTCGENPAEPEHTCPYKAEINDDHETLCICCDDCRYECCQEI